MILGKCKLEGLDENGFNLEMEASWEAGKWEEEVQVTFTRGDYVYKGTLKGGLPI